MIFATDAKAIARKKIDSADKKIARILSKFNMVADPDNPPSLSSERFALISPGSTALHLARAPKNIYYDVVRLLNLEALEPKKTRGLTRDLALTIIERIDGVEGVLLKKFKDGVTDSYDEERHAHVIVRSGFNVFKLGGQFELGMRVTQIIADGFVEMQDEYLEDKTGPIATYVEHKKQASTAAARPPGW